MKINKISKTRLLLIIFFFSITFSTILINLVPFEYVKKLDIWYDNYLRNYITYNTDTYTMLRFILKQRLWFYLVIVIGLLSPFNYTILTLLTFYFGFSWGTISTIILMEQGINGLRTCFFLVFPHFIFYIIAISLIFIKVSNLRNKSIFHVDGTFVAVFIMSMVIVITGCYIETTVSTKIMCSVIKDMLNVS